LLALISPTEIKFAIVLDVDKSHNQQFTFWKIFAVVAVVLDL
jgi:hypothetical protein